MKVGFIGTGAMGRPMARNLVAKGFTVVAYDVEPAALAAARTLGARAAASAAAVAEESEVVVTMLPSSPHVEAAYLGAGGVLEGIAPGRLCVDMSTVDPGTAPRAPRARLPLCAARRHSVACNCDDGVRAAVRARGEDPDALTARYVRLINDVLAACPPGVARSLHMCRGNLKGAWMAEGGYEPIAEAVFGGLAVDAFLLEFDSPRAGGFRSLRLVPAPSASCSDWSARRRRPSSRPTS
jgi:NAD binding domain of 6-phosphogluconate dehydrogenase